MTWKFQCKCGKIITVPSYPVRAGQHKSCGCLSSRKRENGKFILQPDTGNTKVCSHCKQDKNLESFRPNKRSSIPNKKHARCNECEKILHKRPDIKHQRILARKRYLKNRDRYLAVSTIWRNKNKEKLRIARRARERKLFESNPLFKIRKLVSSSIRHHLKQIFKTKKGKSAWNFLPYTREELKSHIEKQFKPWMTWENIGIYDVKTWNDNDQSTWKWQIDHIIPHSEFKYASMADEEFKKCWDLSNL